MQDQFEGDLFVIQPEVLFPNDDLEEWSNVVSDKGMIKLKPVCSYGESGLQVNIAMANPPSDDMEDAWEASKPSGVWDFWEMLGLIRLPSNFYKVQLFFKENTFFDRAFEEVFTKEIEYPEDEHLYDLEKEWAYIFNEVFVKMYGAQSPEGHVWPTE